jgi:hypothetical protein
MVIKPAKLLRPFVSASGYFFTLVVSSIVGVSLLGGTAAIAHHEMIDPRVCAEIFQRETAKCQTLTGFARAACQAQAATRFRTCRGSPASPSAPGPNALASILSPSVVGPSAVNDTGNSPNIDTQLSASQIKKLRTRPSRELKGLQRYLGR